MKTFAMLVMSSALLTASLGHAQEESELSFSADEVSPGLYMLKGVGGFTGGNIGLSVGEDGVVMIDDSMPPMLDILRKGIASVTDKPIDFLINTHVHGDHTGNNASFGKGGAHIVAHENLRQHLLTKGVSTGDGNQPAPKDALPVITFSKSMDFYLNGEQAHIFHVAHAHTDGDAVILFKDANVIHAGDIFFHSMFPYIDLDSGGSVDGYIAAQQKILSLCDDRTKIIPGHGELASKKDLERDNAMLIDAKNRIGKLIDAGKSEDDVVAENPLAKYHEKWNWGFITTERMTRQIYQGLSGGKGGKHAHSH